MRLESRKAIVTGAGSRGIGLAIAEAYAREGADVAVHWFGTRLDEADAMAIRAHGGRLLEIEADLSDPEAARRMVREAARQLGGLDILVANAGVTERVPFLEVSDDAFEHILTVNLRGTFACCQEAAKIMVGASTPGRIIAVSSVNENRVVAGQSHYCASKGGVRQLVRSMALELAPHDINVNCIAPAATLTDMVRDKHEGDPDWARRVAAKYPKGRVAMPEEIAGAAVFLATDESTFVTGTSLLVDGGFSLSH